jgi:lysophospholipase L1-like esterase
MPFKRAATILVLLAGLTCGITATFAPASAQDDTTLPGCSAPGTLVRLDHSIAHTAANIAAGRTLRIVALGSSSTYGTGASSPANNYPSRLEAELRARFPDMDIKVLNRGIGGEDAKEMLARLDKSVIAEHPDLVLWQVGTNAIVNDEKVAVEEQLVRTGIERLKAAGIDVIIVDPQYAPKVIAKPQTASMIRMLDSVAREARVAVFHRFAIMGHWRQIQHLPFDQFTSRDGLHMNDWSYGCMSKLLATAIVDTADKPMVGRAMASHGS